MKRKLNLFVLATILVGASAFLQAQQLAQAGRPRSVSAEKRLQERIIRGVRHELIMLPQFSIFDNLAYKVEGGNVTLLGQVVNPVLRTDAEHAVKRIEGVEKVNNRIEVLPPSPNDDRIRRQMVRALFSDSRLFRYSMGAVPPLHIIVKNGHVALEGVVDSQTDKNEATIKANGVPGVFSVQNNLQVASSGKSKKK